MGRHTRPREHAACGIGFLASRKGVAERALELMCKRALKRVAFHKPVADQGVTRERIANARMLIDQARLLTLNAAWKMDTAGNKVARQEIAMIKVVAPSMACQVIDWSIQAHGGGGMCDDFPLAWSYVNARTLRFADGLVAVGGEVRAYAPSWDPSELDVDHLTLDLSHAATARQSAGLASRGHASTSTPANPSARPATCRRRGRWPSQASPTSAPESGTPRWR